MNTRYFRQSARRVTTIVIGGGHAGLAISHYLSALSVDHVVLERGEMANSWRRERWDSLRLLTPNWQNGLPGQCYRGTDPDGYMGMAEVVEFIEAKREDGRLRQFNLSLLITDEFMPWSSPPAPLPHRSYPRSPRPFPAQ